MTMSEQRKQYLLKYQKEKLKRIPLNVTIEEYEKIKSSAKESGESVNGYIKKAIRQRMNKC